MMSRPVASSWRSWYHPRHPGAYELGRLEPMTAMEPNTSADVRRQNPGVFQPAAIGRPIATLIPSSGSSSTTTAFFFTVDPQSQLFSIPYLESMMVAEQLLRGCDYSQGRIQHSVVPPTFFSSSGWRWRPRSRRSCSSSRG